MSHRQLAKNVGIMSVSVLLSRILGLIRDQVMAFYFGTTYYNDAFNIAYNLPNLLRRLFGEGALSAAFVPIYNEIGIKKGKREQINFALNVLSLLTILLTIITIIGIIFAPLLVKVLYPGLAEKTSLLAVKLSRIIFPYLFFIGLSSTLIAILNSHDYFFMTGLSSGLLNIGMISLIIIPAISNQLTQGELIVFSAWGVILGGFLQTIVNFPYLKKMGYKLKLLISVSNEALRVLWKRFIPAMFGIGIREINLVADALIASFLPIGSISALSYVNRLMQLPLGVFGIATGTAVLPLYSKYVSEEKWQDLSESLRFASISLSALLLPITAIILIMGQDFVCILFERGSFDNIATLWTYQALCYYSIGLLFYGLNQTITPLFYACKDTKTPMVIGFYMVLLNIILNIILMQFLKHRGIALATSLTAILNYMTMVFILKRKVSNISFKGVVVPVIKILFSSFFLTVIFVIIKEFFNPKSIEWKIVFDFCMLIILSLVYILLITILKIPYIDKIQTNLWSKLQNK